MRASLFAIGIAVSTSIASAAAPAPVGQRAVLSVSVQVDGAGQRASKSDGTDVKWSTHRSFEAKVDMVAEKAQGSSAADPKSQIAKAAAYKPSSSMESLQKEAAKCKPDDQACQMAIAMKMMETPDAQAMMADAQAAQEAPPRFQTWRVAPKAAARDMKADYQEQWDAVFLTASREVRNCKLGLPAGAGVLGAKDRESLGNGLKAVSVEVDTQTGKSAMLAALVLYAQGELQCHVNDGGRVSNEKENKGLNFAPAIDAKTNGGWIAGGAPAGAAISRGELTFDSKPDAHALTGMMSVTAPLKVKLRWELTPQ